MDIAKCCCSCKHVFEKTDYEESGDYYCNVDDDRPLCGSVCLGESLFDRPYNEAEQDALTDMWDEWAKDHRVQPYQVCAKHEMREDLA